MKHLMMILFTSCAVTSMYGMERVGGSEAITESHYRFVMVKNKAQSLIEIRTHQLFMGEQSGVDVKKLDGAWQKLKGGESAKLEWLVQYTKNNDELVPERYVAAKNILYARCGDHHGYQNMASKSFPVGLDYANDTIITVGIANKVAYFE